MKEEGAGDHCHIGALSLANQRIFDWLDELWKTEQAQLSVNRAGVANLI